MSGGRSSGKLAAPRVDARPSGRAVYAGNQTVKSSQSRGRFSCPARTYISMLRHGMPSNCWRAIGSRNFRTLPMRRFSIC